MKAYKCDRCGEYYTGHSGQVFGHYYEALHSWTVSHGKHHDICPDCETEYEELMAEWWPVDEGE